MIQDNLTYYLMMKTMVETRMLYLLGRLLIGDLFAYSDTHVMLLITQTFVERTKSRDSLI